MIFSHPRSPLSPFVLPSQSPRSYAFRKHLRNQRTGRAKMRTGATIIVSSTNSIFFPPVATIDLESTFAGLCHCRRPPDVDLSVRPSPRREVQVLQGRGVPTAARVPSPHQRGCGGPSTQAAGHSPKTRAEEAIHLRVHGRWQNRRLTN